MMDDAISRSIAPTNDNRIGVVIPVFNRRTTLLETLQCVVDQTLHPEQLVVVDDGSNDGTAAAATEWLTAARPRFRWQVIRAAHKSAATARNIGLRQVSGLPLIAFLDSDDRWPSDFLQRGVAALAAAPQASAAVADRRFVDACGRCLDENDCRALARDPVTWFFHNGAGVASCSLLRTGAVVQAGAWSEKLESAEDAVLFSAMALSAEWVHMRGAPVVFGHGSARARCEEHNLSERRVDRHLEWSFVFEEIYRAAAALRSERSCAGMRQALSQRWYMAGKQLLKLGRPDESRECFARAIHWQPLKLRAWRKLAAVRLSGRASAAPTPNQRRFAA